MSDPPRPPARAPEADELPLQQSLRPHVLDEDVGQRQIVDNLRVFIRAARHRRRPRTGTLELPLCPRVGATTRAGWIAAPLRARLGIVHRLAFYSPEELARIVARSASLLRIPLAAEGALEIARRSRGTPRVANR